MKVDFSKIKVRPTLKGNEIEGDLTKEIADAVWQGARTVAEADFALSLYRSDGEVEMEEEQREYVRYAVRNAVVWLKRAIYEAMGEELKN